MAEASSQQSVNNFEHHCAIHPASLGVKRFTNILKSDRRSKSHQSAPATHR